MMKYQRFSPSRVISLSFLSFFGIGFIPKAPGTFGSLATIPLLILLAQLQFTQNTVIFMTTLLFLIACFVTDFIQKKENQFDPGWIVIDEVIGMIITWLFVFPAIDVTTLTLVFIFFRLFDIVKIFPANWCDKKIKNGIGTNLDDVISALYAGITVWVIKNFLLIN